ncbi:MAG: 50S ribosomal protein L1 [Bacteroidia bacterium]|nr:50S ribosomal protein L1 [Bacteroidia bacterium]MBB1540597.1 50S ribosomal protein L1 [Bacteroidia bacterium]
MTKKRKSVDALVDRDRLYTIGEAVSLVKKTSYTKFDASVDVDVRLGVDPRKSTEMVRGVVTLPNGSGRTLRVLVLCTPEKEAEAKEAGADMVGLDEYIEKIKGGWLEFDVVVTMPQVMGKIGQLGRVLGPRGLMPNPKSGTVTMEIGRAVKEVKMGKIDFRVDKFGIVHASVGRVSFEEEKLEENVREFIQAVLRLRPATLKGTYVRSIYVSSTMGPGIALEVQQQ